MKAVFSPCGKYRYTLHRNIEQPIRWVKPCLFVLLNPSTADDMQDDPTIRRCISFAKREGCTELTVINLFALRSTNPKGLYSSDDPVGPDNDRHISEQLDRHKSTGLVIAAWGVHGKYLNRDLAVAKLFDDWKCLGKNKLGIPRHPLYLKRDSALLDMKVLI